MTIRIGANPIGWTNDDLQEIGGDTPLETCLKEAKEAGVASRKRGRDQPLLARLQAEGDQFYRGHEGGFPASDVVAVADAIDRAGGARFAGITTFPALLFDPLSRKAKPTPNNASAAI